jgi:tetratricopeptide (TPR) repeat protein
MHHGGESMTRTHYLWLRCRAMAWLVLGRGERALRVFNEMVQCFAGRSYPLASRAHLHAQAGRHTLALADYQSLLALQPDNAVAWFNQGFVLESLGRLHDALAAFTRATELSPGLDRAWYGRGLMLGRLQHFDEAIAALRRNTELQPMSPHGWVQLARIHAECRQPGEALQIIRHLKAFEPKFAAQLERETGLLAGRRGP